MSILDKYNLSEDQRDRVMTKVASTISELQKTDMLEKVAIDWHSPVAQTGLALAATTIGAGISVGIPKLVDAIRAAGIRRNKGEYLKAMKDAHPELKNVSQRDLDLAYNSIAMNSPDVIKDPLLGGQVMKEITGRAMRWDLNQYSTLNRTAGGGLADYEHAAIQQFGKGVGNLSNVYYDASAKAEQAKREQARLDLNERVHTYNTQRDTRAETFQQQQFDYRKDQDTATNAFNKEKFQFEKDKNTEAKAYQDKQLANQDRQFNSQEERDKQQQANFERTFKANEADRTFSQDMSNKNYALAQNRDQAQQRSFDYQKDRDAKIDAQNTAKNQFELQKFDYQKQKDTQQQKNFDATFRANKLDRSFSQQMANKNYNLNRTNQHFNFGGQVESGGQKFDKVTNAHNEAFQRAQAQLDFQTQNQASINAQTQDQSYYKTIGQSNAEKNLNTRIMQQAYDKSYASQAGKEDFAHGVARGYNRP